MAYTNSTRNKKKQRGLSAERHATSKACNKEWQAENEENGAFPL